METLQVIITYFLSMMTIIATCMEFLKKAFKWNDIVIKIVGAVVSILVALAGTFVGFGAFSLPAFIIGSIVLFASQCGINMTVIKPLLSPVIKALGWQTEIDKDAAKLPSKEVTE